VPVNPAGQQGKTRTGTIFVDTVAPRVTLRLPRSASAGSQLHATVGYVDLPPAGRPRSAASGVAKVLIRWGDGTSLRLPVGTHRASHSYRRRGRYHITILVTDKAGNLRGVTKTINVGKGK
jgi:hypothetical protein